jgi:hypothetical protein
VKDPLTVAVAKLIIQLAKDDERDPGRLRDGVLEALGRAAPPCKFTVVTWIVFGDLIAGQILCAVASVTTPILQKISYQIPT